MHEDSGLIAYILIGLPGSGKSTVRREIQDTGMMIISSDDYIETFAKVAGKTYNEVFEEAVGFAQTYVNKTFEECIENRTSFVWDQTNLTKKKRRSIMSRIPKVYKKVAVFVNTPLETCIYRNNLRQRSIPENVIVNMSNQLEVPSLDEGFDEVRIV